MDTGTAQCWDDPILAARGGVWRLPVPVRLACVVPRLSSIRRPLRVLS